MISAQRSLIQIVVLGSVLQHSEPLGDRFFFQRRDPQPPDRQLASGHVINQPENQFTLAAGVCRAYDPGHAGIVHQLFQYNELLARLSNHGVLPLVRDNRKIIVLPYPVLFIVFFGDSGCDQVSNTPAHNKTMPLKKSIVLFACAEHFRDGSGNTGLFSNDKLSHQTFLHFKAPACCQAGA